MEKMLPNFEEAFLDCFIMLKKMGKKNGKQSFYLKKIMSFISRTFNR